ncbi:MAG TPA: Rrf2 family transcriptional regulator [Anaerolineales bacterium]|nr:Rrf2 family transcriptional regulator [Anaerolineales bacterium]
MLRINRQTDYAVRVVLALAKRPEGTRLPTRTIQQEMQIPSAMMLRIVAKLAKGKLVKTFPGREGGVSLSRPAAQITLLHVVEAFEGLLLLSQCLQAKAEDDCPFRSDCPVRLRWGRVQKAMLLEMAATNFEELAREAAEVPLLADSMAL